MSTPDEGEFVTTWRAMPNMFSGEPMKGTETADEKHERVIRCRDCRFYDQTIHSCGRIDTAAKAFVSYAFDDGFCAWAEPKEES